MTKLRFTALPTEPVRALQAGAPDANGQPPESVLATGGGNPCRHCLTMIEPGAPMLILAHRPFPAPQPYAEVGPIFLHAEACEQAVPGPDLPEMLAAPDYIVRGYGANDRIVYSSGGVVARERIAARAAELLADPAIAYVHIRSARNNCYQCRVERG
jgi:hypothetical protein